MKPSIWLIRLMFARCAVSKLALTCNGDAFHRRGVFCYDSTRDVDMLVDSFLELGLDAHSMIGSRPPSIPLLPVPTAAPATTVPPTTNPPASTVAPLTTAAPTTTLPPNRRRVQAGWPASGALPCEDTNPSDAADTDCYASRYATFRDDIYQKMSTMSVAVQTTGTYSDKLGAYIYTVQVPSFQESLALTLQQGVPILKQASSDALSDVQNSVKQAQTDTTTYVTALDTASKLTTASLQSKLQKEFDQLTSLSIKNLNTMITRANDRNSGSDGTAFSAELKQLNTDVETKATNDENTVLGLVNKLTLLQNTVGTDLFYSQSNLTALTLPELISNGSKWVTNKQAYLNTTLGDLVSTITLSNISGLVAQTDAGISSTLTTAETDLNGILSSKDTSSSRRITDLNSFIESAENGIESTYASLQTGIKTAQTNVESGTFSGYTSMQDTLDKLFTFFTDFGAESVSNWESSAVERLTTLKGLVSYYSAALQAEASQAMGSGTEGLQDTVLSSLAKVGHLQNKMNEELLSRQSTGLIEMQKVMEKSSGDAVMFSTLLSNISTAIAALKQSGSPSSPLTLLSNVTSQMDQLALSVTEIARDTNEAISSASSTITTNLTQYNDYVREWWANQSTSGIGTILRQRVDTNVSIENSRLDNVTQEIGSGSNAMATAVEGALANAQRASDQLFESTQKTYGVISTALTQISTEAFRGLRQFSSALRAVHQSLASLWLSSGSLLGSGPSVVQTQTNLDRSVNSLESSVKLAIDGFLSKTQSEILEPATLLVDLVSRLETGTSFGESALTGERNLNNSIAVINATMADLLVREVGGSATVGLAEASSMKDQLVKELAQIETDASAGLSLTNNFHNGMESLVANLQALADSAETSNGNSAGALVAILNAALSINGLLAAETGYLSGGVAEAATAMETEIAKVRDSINVDNLISSLNADVSNSRKSDWTDSLLAQVRASLQAETLAPDASIPNRAEMIQMLQDRVNRANQGRSDLTTDLATSASKASSQSDQVVETLSQTVRTIQSKTGKISAANPLDSVQAVLELVKKTAGAATQDAGNMIVGQTTGAVGGIQSSTEDAKRNFDTLSSTATEAMNSAAAISEAGIKSVNAVSDIVEINRKDRENSAVSVLDQITASGNRMQEMFDGALQRSIAESSSIDSSSGNNYDLPAFIRAASAQLGTFDLFSKEKRSMFSELQSENSRGIESEKMLAAEALGRAGNDVSGSVSSGMKSILTSLEDAQIDLDDRLFKLRQEYNEVSSLTSNIDQSGTSLDLGGISSLNIASGTVDSRISNEQESMSSTERDIDALLAKVTG